MIKFIQFFILLVIYLFTTSCGLGNGGICEFPDLNICIDFNSNLPNAEAKASCERYESIFKANSKIFTVLGNHCSTENRVGSCKVAPGDIRYYNPKWNNDSAKTSCSGLNGTWSSP